VHNSAKPKVYCTQQQTTAENEESRQNTVGTQANDESTKNADECAKATKVLRTTANMMRELPPNMIKVIKIQ